MPSIFSAGWSVINMAMCTLYSGFGNTIITVVGSHFLTWLLYHLLHVLPLTILPKFMIT